MADKKIITDELLKLQTEKVLQVIADNVYQEEEYLEQEIDDMFDATPQEISYYESLINPDVVSENRLWSSKTIDEKLASAILEANKYTDQASTRNLTTEIVSSTADVTKENVLYLILSDASTNTYEQYMLIGGTATALGSTQVDLSNIYNKSEVDTKLGDKANKSEVLSMDSVQATTGSETNDTVYTSKLTKDELDKKANDDEVVKKTDIATDLTTTSGSTTLSTAGLQTELDKVVKTADIKTTLDENSTNDNVYGGKAIFDAIHESISMILSSASDITTLLAKLKSLAPGKSAVIKLYDSSRILFPVEGNYIGTVSVINGNEIIVICVNHWNSKHAYTFRVQTDDTSISLNKICATSVKDIPWTNITGNLLSTKVKFSNADSYASYCVKNGTCYVTIWSMTILAECGVEVLFNGLPEAAITGSSSLKTANASFGLVFTGDGGQILTNVDASCIGRNGYCTLSYPVKES